MTEHAAKAQIHDLGYRRYKGERRPQSARWRVLVRNVLSTSWRGWWNMKVWVIGAAVTITVMAVLMYVMRNEFWENLTRLDSKVPRADGMLPMSFSFLSKFAFILTMTVCAQIIANDLKTGAFEFYFSRPLRPIDYVLGKVVGAVVVIGLVLFVGPVLLSLFRLAIAKNSSQLSNLVWLVPKTVAAAAIATLAYAVIPLAFSALSSNRRYAIAAWAVFHLVVSNIAVAIAANPKLNISALGAINMTDSLLTVIYRIFDMHRTQGYSPPLWSAITMLTLYFSAGFGIVYWRVSKAQRSGMGG